MQRRTQVPRVSEIQKSLNAGKLQCCENKRGCFNCLQLGLNVRNCPSKFTCRECIQKHHTLLHRASQVNTTAVEGEGTSREIHATSVEGTASSRQMELSFKKTVLLSTAYLMI